METPRALQFYEERDISSWALFVLKLRVTVSRLDVGLARASKSLWPCEDPVPHGLCMWYSSGPRTPFRTHTHIQPFVPVSSFDPLDILRL